jgi:drug/metabolite transporter (DMT)-like permease
MSALQFFLTIVCVLAICVGQILFKYVGVTFQNTRTLLDPKVIAMSALALTIYGAATVLWIYLLRFIPLSRAYPYMALSFVIVPVFSAVLFREPLSLAYFMGTALILSGLVVVSRLG